MGLNVSYEDVYLIPCCIVIHFPLTISRVFQSRETSASPSPEVKTSTLVISGDEGQSFHRPVSWADAWLILLESHLYPQLLDPPIPECLEVRRYNKFTLTSRSAWESSFVSLQGQLPCPSSFQDCVTHLLLHFHYPCGFILLLSSHSYHFSRLSREKGDK